MFCVQLSDHLILRTAIYLTKTFPQPHVIYMPVLD